MTEDLTNKPLTGHDLIEFYAAASPIEADRVVLLLAEEEIEATVRETSIPVFPTSGTSRYLVTVFHQDKEKANDLIKQAISDNILSSQGSLL